MSKTTLGYVYAAIERELIHQRQKHGPKQHDVPGWLLILEDELREAKEAWLKGNGTEDALRELTQVVAVGVACMLQHGVVERWGVDDDSTTG